MRDTLGVLLAGGAGERLFPLTRDRAKPAVPFAGQYRIIDITLSNCINSDLRHVYILTQYKALSLNRHIREGWGPVVANELGEFIEILPPMQRVSKSWYQGTADAVYQNIYSIGSEEPKHVIILSGDHIYKMNYALMLEQHNDSGADVTIATLPVAPTEVAAFGVVEVARNGEVTAFEEKPKETKIRSPFNPDMVDVSMGIYIFIDENKQKALYWRDVGTLEAYYEANMDVAGVTPTFNLYDKSWPMRTRPYQYPPAKFVFGEPGRTGMAINSIVCSGSIVSGAVIRNSVLSQNVRVNSYADVDSSIVFSHVNIGRHCRIRHAIIDRDVHIPDGTVIGYDPNEDKKNYFVSSNGLTVVTRDYSVYENPVSPGFLQPGSNW